MAQTTTALKEPCEPHDNLTSSCETRVTDGSLLLCPVMMAPLGTDQLDTETRHSLHNTNRVSNIKDEDIIRANYNFINTAVQLADGRTNEETNEQK